ncbi:MAG TPA: hypothetical protein VEF76_05560 [Patescibacteria group bacterium]|nr:hypothetical protein [Patescibacteria group bacterium]
MGTDKAKQSKAKGQFDQAVAGEAYYSIFSIEPAPDDTAPGKWEVLFFVSGSKDDVGAPSPLSTAELHRILNRYYAKHGRERPEFEGELSKNMHLGRVATKERAERLAAELTYIFEDAGLSPMKEQLGKFQPMSPETSRPMPKPKLPKPPKFGRA